MMGNEKTGTEGQKIKRLEIGNFPFLIGLGGKEASKDTKIMFFDKKEKKHLTIRIIFEEKRLVLDFHMTDEKDNSHKSIGKMIIDAEGMIKDKDKVEKQFMELPSKIIAPANDEYLEGKILVPIVNDGLITQKKPKKTMFLDSDRLMELVGKLKGTKALQENHIDRTFVQEGKIHKGTLLLIKGSWYYMDVDKLRKEAFLILKPYLDVEGMDREEFLNGIEAVLE